MSIRPGIYRHYKGGEYEVFNTVIHSETLEEMVLYQPLYGEQKLWVRPLEMFTESVTVKGEPLARFSFVGPKK